MKGKLPALTGEEVIQALERGGFTVVRIRSSHHFLRDKDGRTTVVPVHVGETIGPGLISKILRDCGLDRKQFRALLRQASHEGRRITSSFKPFLSQTTQTAAFALRQYSRPPVALVSLLKERVKSQPRAKTRREGARLVYSRSLPWRAALLKRARALKQKFDAGVSSRYNEGEGRPSHGHRN